MDKVFCLKYPFAGRIQRDEDGYARPDLVLPDRYEGFSVSGYEGVMDRRTGKVIIPPLYYNIEMISESLFSGKIERFDEQVIMDASGKVISQEHLERR